MALNFKKFIWVFTVSAIMMVAGITTASALDLSSLNGTNGFKINGEFGNDWAGYSVSGAGDVNGDGVGDIIIGARQANTLDAGGSYVVFGSDQGFPALLELSSLDGSNGFELVGEAPGDQSGWSVSAAGDVNGDGVDDLIIGAPNVDANGTNSGAAYVVYGSQQGFPAQFALSSLDGSNGFKLNGEAELDLAGFSVSGAGDINNDGVGDISIGARLEGRRDTGATYVVFGSLQGFPAEVELSDIDQNSGFKLIGAARDDWAGYSVSAAGDINGDGIDDLTVGTLNADPNGSQSGESYVVFGGQNHYPPQLAGLNGKGFALNGEAAGDLSGTSVSAAGDINGDGLDDLIVGAPGADPNGALSGSSYVVFGSPLGFTQELELSSLDGSNGFKLNGVESDYSGNSVAAAGDVNGDGIGDLIIGAPAHFANLPDRAGSAYVVYGSPQGLPAQFELSSLNGTNGFKINGEVAHDAAGWSVSAAGDVNGDGVGDLIIGAPEADNRRGSSYVVFGTPAVCDLIDPALVYERLSQIVDPNYTCYSDGIEYFQYIARAGDGSVEVEIGLEDLLDGSGLWYGYVFEYKPETPGALIERYRYDLTPQQVQQCRIAFEPTFSPCAP